MFPSMTRRLVTGETLALVRRESFHHFPRGAGGATARKRAPFGNADVLVGALDVTFSISADEDVRVPRDVEA